MTAEQIGALRATISALHGKIDALSTSVNTLHAKADAQLADYQLLRNEVKRLQGRVVELESEPPPEKAAE